MKLKSLVYRDHVSGCDNECCDITAAYNSGNVLWSAYLILSAGAASNELNKVYNKIKPSKGDLDAECRDFINTVPYTTCDQCSSVNWNTELGDQCWNCLKGKGI